MRGLRRMFAGGLLLSALSGCAINPHQNCCDPEPKNAAEAVAKQQRYTDLIREHQLPENSPIRWERPIFRFTADHGIQAGKPILLLHEYPAMSINTFTLADKLAARGYTVYVPTLFGKPLEQDVVGNSLYLALSSDWDVVFSEHATSPIVGKLRELAQEIDARHGHRGIAVIGQCLTGSFPIALLSEPCVKAAVCAQPATPLLKLTEEGKKTLGLSEADIALARKSSVPVLALRFRYDMISPPERLEALKEVFPATLEIWTIPAPVEETDPLWTKYGIGPQAHPTLTYCLPADEKHNPRNPVNIAFEKVVSFLKKNL